MILKNTLWRPSYVFCIEYYFISKFVNSLFIEHFSDKL